MRITFALAFALSLGIASAVCAIEKAKPGGPAPERAAGQILEVAGVHGGLVVHVGCGDGKLTAALGAGDAVLVHGLAVDPEAVEAAREHVRSLGTYGKVSIDRLAGARLPYVDNLVNLIVVERRGAVSADEIVRVLAPRGVALIATTDSAAGPRPSGAAKIDRVEAGGRTWTKIVKARPKTIDDWSHYLHDASNNAVAHDAAVGPPRRLQWVGSPRYSRHHDRMSSVSAVVTAGGRVFTIFDEATRASILVPPRWRLIARDAFNGTILWKRPIEHWYTHLWPLKSGPAQLPRRLVADADRVYVTLGLDAPLVALDAATGATIRTYEATRATEEVLLSKGVLFALVNDEAEKSDYDGRARFGKGYGAKVWDEVPRRIMAIDAATGRVMWAVRQRVLPGTLAVDARRVAFHDGERIVALDRNTGQSLWRSKPIPRAEVIRGFYLPILVLYQDIVLFSGGETAGKQTGSWYESGEDTMTALDASTGNVLWSAYHPPSGYRSPEDLLVVDGLVWTGETTSGRVKGVFTGRDPRTGEVKREFAPDVTTYWFHHRCYRGKATDRFLLMARAGTEFIDVRKQHWIPHHWVRGACLYGVMPANGLLYAPQHPCACYLEAKLAGFNALAPSSESRAEPAESRATARLEKGPAYGAVAAWTSQVHRPGDWPTYRHDAARSGCASTTVPAALKPAWQTRLGGRLSSVVVADGKLLVAEIDGHTVHALDAESGRSLWHYTVGGRVDSPPTICTFAVPAPNEAASGQNQASGGAATDSLCLFGSADGWVYCLRVSDGALVWRFRAAPADQRLVACEQVESVWPVPGNVMVQDGAAWCVAGRSMFLDGGLRLWRLDPQTGRVLSETVLDDTDPRTGKKLQAYVSWLNMPTAMPDVLSSDGRHVYMRSQPFQLDGTRLPLEAMPSGPDADRGAPPATQRADLAHLFCPTGLLDDSWWHRTYWLYGSRFVSGWCGYFRAGKAAPAGRILVFDDSKIYGFGRKPKFYRWTTPIEHHLFSADKMPPPASQQDRERPGVSKYLVKLHWTEDLPLFVRAMVLADGTLFVAGPPDLVDEEQAIKRIFAPATQQQLREQAAALEGKKGGIVWAVSAADGKRLAELKLEAPPVFDGMAAAKGRLYMTTTDGSVLCLAGETSRNR